MRCSAGSSPPWKRWEQPSPSNQPLFFPALPGNRYKYCPRAVNKARYTPWTEMDVSSPRGVVFPAPRCRYPSLVCNLLYQPCIHLNLQDIFFRAPCTVPPLQQWAPHWPPCTPPGRSNQRPAGPVSPPPGVRTEKPGRRKGSVLVPEPPTASPTAVFPCSRGCAAVPCLGSPAAAAAHNGPALCRDPAALAAVPPLPGPSHGRYGRPLPAVWPKPAAAGLPRPARIFVLGPSIP